MNTKRTSIITMLIAVLFTSLATPTVLANELATSKEHPKEITISNFSLDEIPEGITPLYFDTQEEADIYMAEFEKAIAIEKENYEKLRAQTEKIEVDEGGIIPSDVEARYNDYTIEVDVWQSLPTKITLSAHFGTTGASKTGTVTYVSPYTTYTGLTIFSSWDESTCDYNLDSNKKDAYIFASGTANLYFIIDGIGNIKAFPVELGRQCFLAR